MNRFRSRALLLSCALLVPVLAACPGDRDTNAIVVQDTAPAMPGADAAEVPADVQARARDFTSAWNGNDPAAVAAFFTEDATATVGDSTYTGRADIEQRWLAANVPAVSNLQVTEDDTHMMGPDVMASGSHTFSAADPQGQVQQMRGTHQLTWTRDADGEWRIRNARLSDGQPQS
jgi:uncharacterized protein (TIGR02246 family)